MLTSGRLKISSLPSLSFLYQSLSFPTMYQTCDLVYDHHFKKQIPRQTILLQCRCESMALQILDIYRPCLAPYPRNLIPKDSETPAFQRQKPKMHRGNCWQKIFIKAHMLECLNKYQCIAKVKPKYHRLGWGGLHIATIATEALIRKT